MWHRRSIGLICLTAAPVLTLLGSAETASADTRPGDYRSRTSGPWNMLGTWEVYDNDVGWRTPTLEDGEPGMDHRATIQAGHTVFVGRDAEVDKLSISRGLDGRPPGTLDIAGGARLIIHHGLDMERRPKEATPARIVFSGRQARPGVLQSNAILDLYGDVEVTGRGGGVIHTAHQRQLISIGRHARLTSSGGPLVLAGTIEMDGQVFADGPHPVVLSGFELREGSSGKWFVRHPRATLRFEPRVDTVLRSGEIHVNDGVFEVATNLTTSGVVTRQRGAVRVDPECAFQIRGKDFHSFLGDELPASPTQPRASR